MCNKPGAVLWIAMTGSHSQQVFQQTGSERPVVCTQPHICTAPSSQLGTTPSLYNPNFAGRAGRVTGGWPHTGPSCRAWHDEPPGCCNRPGRSGWKGVCHRTGGRWERLVPSHCIHPADSGLETQRALDQLFRSLVVAGALSFCKTQGFSKFGRTRLLNAMHQPCLTPVPEGLGQADGRVGGC